jgi:hypothetical protein
MEVTVELLCHETDTGAGEEPLGPASWLERLIFPSDFLGSGK